MREYTYIAKDTDGKTVHDELFAINERLAVQFLHRRGMTIIKLDEIVERSLYDRLFRRVKPSLLVLVFRQMSALMTAGIPMQRTLNIISKTEGVPTHFRKALERLVVDVSSGYTLSQAMSLFPEYFTPFLVGSVRIGEVSGKLASTVENCAECLNQEYAYNLRLKQAFIYPTVLLGGVAVLMTFCFTWMIPTFVSMFAGLNMEMPGPTQFLIKVTDFINLEAWHMTATAAPGIIFSLYVFNVWRRTRAGRWYMENFLQHIPWFGTQFRLRMQSNYFRSLATLMDSAIPLVSSLTLLTRGLEYETLRATARFQLATIQNGGSLTAGMRRSGLFAPLTMELVHMAEETATVPRMLSQLATSLDEEMSASLQMVSKIIEPIILGILGVGVCFILIAVFMPIYSLAQNV